MSTYQEFKERFHFESDKLQSSPWTMGGTHSNCYGDTYPITPEEMPVSFDEFDQLMEKINDTMTFLQYKSIYRACVRIETEVEGDYYGGRAYQTHRKTPLFIYGNIRCKGF